MAKTVTSRYDVAEHLRTPKEMAAYLEACLEEADGDAAFVAKALGDIARAKGMSQIARDTGLSRESLYKALYPLAQRYIGFKEVKLEWDEKNNGFKAVLLFSLAGLKRTPAVGVKMRDNLVFTYVGIKARVS